MVAMVPVVMTPPVVVMAPVIMVTPVAIVTDAPRTVIGPDHPAAAVGIIIGVVVIGVVRAVEETPVKVMAVCEPNAAEPGATEAMASAVEDRTAAKPAAVEYGTAGSQAATMKHRAAAAVKHRAATMKAASAMETTSTVEAATAVKAAATSTTVETTPSATAMSTTADFGCKSAGGGFRGRCRARIDQRQRLRALWNS
jgi:hypothetical protein